MWLLAMLFSCGGSPQGDGHQNPTDGATSPDVETNLGLPGDGKTRADPVCDAGDEAFVQRIFPLVLGRRPDGAAEVGMWVDMIAKHGRPAAVRALANDPLYAPHWKAYLSDLLHVARSGPDFDSTCWQNPNLAPQGGALAQFVRDNAADAGGYGQSWNMADLALDALELDDVSVLYRANIFARTNYVPFCANSTEPHEIETERRVSLGDDFISDYTKRNVTCMSCHNSEYSATDDPDPKLDRTWGEPALFEQSLFGNSYGPTDTDGFYSAFKYKGVVYDIYDYTGSYGTYNAKPWGWDQACGQFNREAPAYDYLDVESGYFLGDIDASSTLWDIESSLRVGVDAISVGALDIAPDKTVPPDQAFAYLTAKHVVDQVWQSAFGNALTLPYGFSRNQAQHERLVPLTEHFVANGWSLRELLVDITADPYFNAGLPSTCGAQAYGMDPIIDPYSADDPNTAVQGNGPGDLVHRQFARTLIESARHSLGWSPPEEFFTYYGYGYDDGEEELATAIGVFLSSGQPGFNGIDFQGMLAWESLFGTCSDPSTPDDMVHQVVSLGMEDGATVEDAALAIKDRLTARGAWDDDSERADVEDLMQTALSTPLSSLDHDSPVQRNLRLYCGLLTLTPEFQLANEPKPVGPWPRIDLGTDDACERVVRLWGEEGVTVTCVAGHPTE